MARKSVKLKDIIVKYGQTTVQELLDLGYKIKDLVQILEEPTLTECNLYKNDKQVASLTFYDINKTITLNKLSDFPIDFVYLFDGKKSAYC